MLPNSRCVPPSTSKYAPYTECEAMQLALPQAYAQGVVIPALGEGTALWTALASIPGPHTLAVLVLNGRADADAWVHQNNTRRLAEVGSHFGAGRTLLHSPHCTLHAAPFGALLCINRTAAPHWLPKGQGVGLARKIGCDVAWAQIIQGRIHSPWIHCTDADVQLPADYFAQSAAHRQPAALVYRFEHEAPADPALAQASAAYEASLHYYVRGLQHAGSPYAFHTIGSTVAVHAEAYAAVRGFPKRNAAEDFYLLNKLRKVGPVLSLQGAPIRIASRVSQRVPFGTGKALWRLITEGDGCLAVYHPDTFDYLRAWLTLLDGCAHPGVALHSACAAAPVPNPALLWQVLQQLEAPQALATAHRQTRTVANRQRFLHTWFDAFRTLRFVHILRDAGLPAVPQALAT